MTMLKTISLFSILALAACASLPSVQQAPPSRTFTSSRSSAELEQCIGMALSRVVTPNTVRGPNSIVMAFGQPPAATVTVLDNGTARTVELRTPMTTDGKIVKWMTPCI